MAFNIAIPTWAGSPKTHIAAILANFVALWPYTTAGDIAVGASSTGNLTRLPLGTALQRLRCNAAGTALEYAHPAVAIKTADYTLAADEYVVANKATAITLTLPAATGSGKCYTIKNVGAGVCTIDGNGSETIDSETTQTLQQWEAVTVIDYAIGTWAAL